MRSKVFAILTVGWAIAAICARAQNLPGSKKEVAQFVRYDSKTTILDHVRVIDGTGSAPKENQTIVISNGRIASISSAPPATIPNDATRLNLEGRTVMPGLVMLHEHMFYFSGFRVWHSQAVSYPRLYLAAGVTTLRTAGTDVPWDEATHRYLQRDWLPRSLSRPIS